MRYVETIVLTPEEAQQTLVFKRYDPITGEGYQRNLVKSYVEGLAAAVRDNTWTFPVINGVRHGKHIEVVDGQNRSLAAQLAGINTVIAVWEIAEVDRTQVFIDWNKSKPVAPEHILQVSGLGKRLQLAFSKCHLDVEQRRTSSDNIAIKDAAHCLCMVSGFFGSFNKRVDYLKSMSEIDMSKHAMKVCRIVGAVSEREQPKFEANLVRLICYLAGKIDLTDEHVNRICNQVAFVSSGNVDKHVKQSIIGAMNRHDVKTWPK